VLNKLYTSNLGIVECIEKKKEENKNPSGPGKICLAETHTCLVNTNLMEAPRR